MGHEAVVPFALVSLAILRLATMLSSEDGPFYVFSSWRKKLMDWERRRGRPHWIIDGFHCALCLSWWMGFAGGFLVPHATWIDYLVISVALSSVTLIVKRRIS